MPDKILVTGATGNVGSEVVKQLAGLSVSVRALVRDRTKAAAIEGRNVEIVEGDLSKPSTLGPAFDGVRKALISSSPDPRQAALQNGVIDAAKRAGVRHVVKISAMGAAPNSPISFGRWHAETERYLEQSGVPFTILRPNFFMQNVLMSAGTIAAEGKFYASMKDGKASFVDVRDIGAAAAQALAGSGHEGKTYQITGPEALSFADIARKLSAVLKRPVTYVDIPREALIQALTSAGLQDWMARGIADLYDWGSQGGFAEVTDVVAKVGKRQPITFDRFASDFAAAFEKTATAR
jgi:uncharacterized protein YbjT (DUF2867 family)